jgi:hypothetical protein
MKIEYVQGDLFDMVEPGVVIPHVCNCDNKWGRGFVVPLIQHYLKARTAFDDWYNGKQKDWMPPCQLGRTQIVEVEPQIYVANMVAQVFYCWEGLRSSRPLYYNALVTCMESVARSIITRQDASPVNLRILAPKFGSELAGGNWDFIEDLIYDIWIEKQISVTIVEYNK